MTKKERFNSILGWFAENQPVAQSELHFANPYQLLVAVILSAQCTDRRVNLVTPPLFERFPTPAELSSAGFDDVYPYVKSVSYPNAKARHLIAMARMLMADYNGEVPADIDALMRLPGVGRKTANVIASIVYDRTEAPPLPWSRTWNDTFPWSSAPFPTTGSSCMAATCAWPANPSARSAPSPPGAYPTPFSTRPCNK